MSRKQRSGRITPTYMGNTTPPLTATPQFQDHPHIHGEYLTIYQQITNRLGSPPHTWGIRQKHCSCKSKSGITPTYMGNTRSFAQCLAAFQDHPHIHGEYNRCPLRQLMVSRITPTYMGNTEYERIRVAKQ